MAGGPDVRVLAIDPGPVTSGFVVYDGVHVVVAAGALANSDLVEYISFEAGRGEGLHVALERIQFYGAAVGGAVFETLFWSGRFAQAAAERQVPVHRLYFADVKKHFCGGRRVKESHIRQAVLERFGGRGAALGVKAHPGPLYSVKSHAWSALALALLWWDRSRDLRTVSAVC